MVDTQNSFMQLPREGYLAEVSADLKRMLGTLATEIEVAAGQAIFEEGDDGDALYAVIKGALEVSVLSQDGRKLALDVMREGDLFGEIALFDPGPRTATVTAIERSLLLRIRNAEILREVRTAPELAIDLINLAGRRMRWMHSQLREQVFLPMATRLARKVLHLAPEDPKGPARLTLTQSDLAGHVGATREAVSKTLATWKRLGVVEATRKGLLIRDRDALIVLAALDQE
jgi:CRP-like cAMP-binding protein